MNKNLAKEKIVTAMIGLLALLFGGLAKIKFLGMLGFFLVIGVFIFDTIQEINEQRKNNG